MTNMFANAWRNKAHTSAPAPVVVPVESHQIMGKEVPQSVVEKFEHSQVVAPVPTLELAQTPEPIQVTECGTDIDVATTGPVEVIILTRDEIDRSNEVRQEDIVNDAINRSPLPDKDVTINDLENLSYESSVNEVNATLRDLDDATTESAYTYGINKLRSAKQNRPDDWIVGHIFCGSYDLWITEYNEAGRYFFGFASFGGLLDDCAEWGSVSVDELLGLGFPKPERDFYWTPCTLESLMDEESKRQADAYEQREKAIELGADMTELPAVREVDGGIEMDIDITDPAMKDLVASVVDNPETLAIPDEHPRVAEIKQEVIDHELPFSQAEEPASSTPDISWFYKPGYRKYETAPRATERKDRLVGNMVEEHGDDLQSLYQGFSGKGGLHEVEFRNCESFHEFTEMKQEFELGEFFTPDHIAETMVKILRIPKTANVIDFTAGMGRFFNFIENEERIYGYDVSFDNTRIMNKLYPAMKSAYTRDVFKMNLYSDNGAMQYSIGNPPFNLVEYHMWHHPLATQIDEEDGGKGIVLSQNAYLHNTFNYLVPGGISFFIVPDSWLHGLRHKKVSEYIAEHFYMIAELRLDDNAFSEYGVKFPTKALLLVKKAEGLEYDLPTYQGTFDRIEEFLVSPQYQAFLKLKYKADHSQAEIKLKKMRQTAEEDNRRLYVRDGVLKSIYETYRDKPMAKPQEGELTEMQTELTKEEKKAQRDALRNFEKHKTEMSIFEVNTKSYQFDELMRTQKRRLDRALSRPEKEDEMFIEFIISRYDIIIKRSNTKVVEYFNKPENCILDISSKFFLPNKYSKNELCTNDAKYEEFQKVIAYLQSNTFKVEYAEEDRFITAKCQKGLMQYVNKIRREYQLNTCWTDKLKENNPVEYEENYEKLSEITYKEGTIKLLPHQVEDLSAVLLKRNALISWDTGLGKTLGGITWSMMKGGKTLVIAPAVNTIDPWAQQLKEYRPEATVLLLKKSSDIYKYKDEDYLIVSFESLPNIYKDLANLHFRNLILDESDNAKNKTSKRFKSLRAIAKRFKNRLLMSGTPTRNNVNEIYNQIELLAQNSNAMMCWATEMVEYDRSSREWTTANNPHFGKPFPAWGGYKAFENTFSPKKLTCFGAAETNQDIFNKDIFDNLVRSIRFTRIFDVEKPRINAVLNMEDTGEYKEYKQVMVPMNATENKVYDFILTDLAQQMEEYYRALHDGATASMLVIMQQIMKLMQGTSHPWTFEGYEDGEGVYHQVYDLPTKTSTKLEKACEIITEVFKKPGSNKVMMASPWRETSEVMYQKFIENGWEVFRLESEMSKHKRAAIVSAFRAWPGNAIICGTMGVLKSGLNLPEVNTVIAESYPWNFAQLHQYAARAVRLNSTEKTDIYCLTSEGSFDINVFSLILRKEVTNTFVRTSEETSMEELSKNFGVESTNLFDQAMQMVKEKTNGKTRGTIRWGSKPVMNNSDGTSITITYADKEKFLALADVEVS